MCKSMCRKLKPYQFQGLIGRDSGQGIMVLLRTNKSAGQSLETDSPKQTQFILDKGFKVI